MRTYQTFLSGSLNQSPGFNGGALLGDDGSETPITESMVQTALVRLAVQEMLDRTRQQWQVVPVDLDLGISAGC